MERSHSTVILDHGQYRMRQGLTVCFSEQAHSIKTCANGVILSRMTPRIAFLYRVDVSIKSHQGRMIVDHFVEVNVEYYSQVPNHRLVRVRQCRTNRVYDLRLIHPRLRPLLLFLRLGLGLEPL